MNKKSRTYKVDMADPAADPPDPRRTSESSNPKPTTAAKAQSISVFQMQQYLLATSIKNDEQAVYLATNLLRGDAATWWRHHFKKITDDEDKLPDWKQFKRLIRRKFKPVNAAK